MFTLRYIFTIHLKMFKILATICGITLNIPLIKTISLYKNVKGAFHFKEEIKM